MEKPEVGEHSTQIKNNVGINIFEDIFTKNKT
jgi:hypothetical protein